MTDLYNTQTGLGMLSIVNFGSYDGLTMVPFAMTDVSGMPALNIIGGETGSGKSTLLDALTAVIFGRNWGFNKASEQANGSSNREKRTLFKYIRGEQGTVLVDGQPEIKMLRPNTERPVYSAICATFGRFNDGSVISALFLAYIPIGGGGAKCISSKYAIFHKPIDLRRIEEMGYGSRQFTKSDIQNMWGRDCQVFDSSKEYLDVLYDQLGTKASAMKILFKVESNSNFGTPDELYKRLALDDPQCTGSFPDLLETCQSSLDQLDQYERVMKCYSSFKAVVDGYTEYAKRQTKSRFYQGLLCKDKNFCDDNDKSSQIEVWAARNKCSIVQQSLDMDASVKSEDKAMLDSLKDKKDLIYQELMDLEAQCHEAGEERIQSLKNDIVALERERNHRSDIRSREGAHIRAAEVDPETEDTWNRTFAEAQTWRQGKDEELHALDASYIDALAASKKMEEAAIEAEEALRQRKENHSAITASMKRDRELIADRCGFDIERIPFLAEVIDIKDDSASWRLAVNAVLSPITHLLLVQKQDEKRVRDAIHMIDDEARRKGRQSGFGNRYKYVAVDTASCGRPAPVDGHISEILSINEESAFANYVASRIFGTPYDYRLAETAEDLAVPGSLLISGQASLHDGGAFGFDLKESIIGFNSQAMIDEAEAEYQRCISEHDAAKRAEKKIDSSRQSIRKRVNAIDALSTAIADYSYIDVLGATKQIESKKHELEIASSNDRLQMLQKERDSKKTEYGTCVSNAIKIEEAINLIGENISKKEDKLHGYEKEVAKYSSVPIQDTYQDYLDKALDTFISREVQAPYELCIFTAGKAFKLDMAFNAIIRDESKRNADAEDAEKTARASLESAMVAAQALDDFNDDGDLSLTSPTVDNYETFKSKYDKLNERRIDMMDDSYKKTAIEIAATKLATYCNRWHKDQSDAGNSLSSINKRMEAWPFGKDGGRIYIKMVSVSNSDASDLIGLMSSFGTLSTSLSAREDDPSKDLVKYRKKLSNILDRLNIEREKGPSCSAILNPYLLIRFEARLRKPDEEAEYILDGSGTMSGGEKEEFFYFLTASALLLNQGVEVGEKPSFAPYIIDEAFIHSDAATTKRCFDFLMGQGFQVIVVATQGKLAAMESSCENIICVAKDTNGRSRLADFISEDAEEPYAEA